jgi:hypothetical protein
MSPMPIHEIQRGNPFSIDPGHLSDRIIAILIDVFASTAMIRGYRYGRS